LIFGWIDSNDSVDSLHKCRHFPWIDLRGQFDWTKIPSEQSVVSDRRRLCIVSYTLTRQTGAPTILRQSPNKVLSGWVLHHWRFGNENIASQEQFQQWFWWLDLRHWTRCGSWLIHCQMCPCSSDWSNFEPNDGFTTDEMPGQITSDRPEIKRIVWQRKWTIIAHLTIVENVSQTMNRRRVLDRSRPMNCQTPEQWNVRYTEYMQN
jgi:hypothetical protein